MSTETEPDGPSDTTERGEALSSIVALVRERYVFPERADAVATALSNLPLDAPSSAPEWARAVTVALQASSGDLHLRVFFRETFGVVDNPEAPAPFPAREPADRSRQDRADAQGIGAVERLPGNVGLLRMRGFVDPASSGPHLAAAMTLVSGTDALIIDLRTSRGGSPEAVQLLMSHFVDGAREPLHLNDIVERGGAGGTRTRQYRTLAWLPSPRYLGRPVVVLTSRRTFSAAEELAYDLQVNGLATVVGEQTRGGAHPSELVGVTAHFELSLPHSRSVNPVTGTNWEGVGVTPDIPVSEEGAWATAYARALRAVVAAEDTDDAVRREARDALAALDAGAEGGHSSEGGQSSEEGQSSQ